MRGTPLVLLAAFFAVAGTGLGHDPDRNFDVHRYVASPIADLYGNCIESESPQCESVCGLMKIPEESGLLDGDLGGTCFGIGSDVAGGYGFWISVHDDAWAGAVGIVSIQVDSNGQFLLRHEGCGFASGVFQQGVAEVIVIVREALSPVPCLADYFRVGFLATSGTVRIETY